MSKEVKLRVWVHADAELAAMTFGEAVNACLRQALAERFILEDSLDRCATNFARSICAWQLAQEEE